MNICPYCNGSGEAVADTVCQHCAGQGVVSAAIAALYDKEAALWSDPIPCSYCGPGKITGLPGNACENCMNTGLENGGHGDAEA